MESKKHKSIWTESLRKSIHISGLLFPILYWYLPKNVILILLGAAFAAAIVVESLRFTNPSFQRLFNRSVGFLLRKGEFRRPTGATYWIAGALVTILIYPKKIAIFAVVMLTVSDAFAAGVGKSVGKIKIKAHKTVEGSLAFFLSAFLIGRVFLGFSNPLSVFGAFVGAVLELRLIPVNDNLMVPIGSGFLLVLFQYFVK